MPSLRQRLTVQQILLIEIDLRQMLLPDLHLNPAGCTGGVPTAIVIERKTQCLRDLQESQSMRNLAAFAFRVKKVTFGIFDIIPVENGSLDYVCAPAATPAG